MDRPALRRAIPFFRRRPRRIPWIRFVNCRQRPARAFRQMAKLSPSGNRRSQRKVGASETAREMAGGAYSPQSKRCVNFSRDERKN